MAVTYELWNTDTGNLVGTFETEEAALETVRKALRSHGLSYVSSLLLGRENHHGRSKKIAQGADLARLAGESAPGAMLVATPAPSDPS